MHNDYYTKKQLLRFVSSKLETLQTFFSPLLFVSLLFLNGIQHYRLKNQTVTYETTRSTAFRFFYYQLFTASSWMGVVPECRIAMYKWGIHPSSRPFQYEKESDVFIRELS